LNVEREIVQDDTPHTTEPSSTDAAHSQRELERRIFHLKTLYEVSQVIGSLRDPQQIMKNLLLMVIGTFGALKGVAFLVDVRQGRVAVATQRRMAKTALAELSQAVEAGDFDEIKGVTDIQMLDESEIRQQGGRKLFAFLAASQIHVWIPFAVNEHFKGGIGLGAKMLGAPYTPEDQELLSTLANQLTIALDNALAYMEIHQLNIGLEATVQERTAELRTAMEKLTEVNQQLELHNRFIRETFGRYLSNAVVASLLESPTGLELGGVRRHVTILMSDLRGFTSLVGHLAPEQVVTIINRYLGAMVDVILQYEGTINEFIGDAIFVIFGAPLWWPDHAQRAVACAVAMQLAMVVVNTQNRQDGLPEVEMGIGVNTGEVVVGNIGSQRRAKYGVLGTHVNLTSRIESYTIGGQILISQSTLQAVGPILRIAQRMEIEAKGIDGPITLYDVRGIGGEHNLFLPEGEDTFLPLAERIPVTYTVLQGKYLEGGAFLGSLVKLSFKGGEIHSNTLVSSWSNIRIQLTNLNGEPIPGHLYGKIIRQFSEGPAGFSVHFTSMAPEVVAFFQSLLAVHTVS
jgi:class 3 adenylate cyclase